MNPIRAFVCRAIVLSLVAACSAPASHAAPLCDDFNKVISDAPNLFKNLRGDYDFVMEEYKGTVTIGQFRNCSTESDQGVTDYKCSIHDLPDDEGAARQQMLTYAEQLKQCLGTAVRRYKAGDKSVHFEIKPDDEGIGFQIGRRVPKDLRRSPSYYILFDITMVDPSHAP